MHERGFPARELLQEPKQSARRRATGNLELDGDHVSLRRRGERAEVEAERNDGVLALEAVARRLRGLLRGCEKRVDAGSEAVAAGASRGISEPVDREERRRSERVRRVQREVGQAGESRLEPVHDVEAALGQREAEVRSHGDRHAHVRPSREWDRRADGDDLRIVAALERPAPGQEVARARGRRQDRHRMAALAERFRRAVDVRVHLVRLRPRERRDEADAETHSSQVTTCTLAGRRLGATPELDAPA